MALKAVTWPTWGISPLGIDHRIYGNKSIELLTGIYDFGLVKFIKGVVKLRDKINYDLCE